jgi:hypothetical protein
MIVADHGPCVSGAHNTIVATRAGKDILAIHKTVQLLLLLTIDCSKILLLLLHLDCLPSVQDLEVVV